VASVAAEVVSTEVGVEAGTRVAVEDMAVRVKVRRSPPNNLPRRVASGA